MTNPGRIALVLAVGAALSSALLPAQGTADPNLDRAHHVLRRITFGPDRALVARLAAGLTEVNAYIAEQLNPPAQGAPNYRGSQSLDELFVGAGGGPGTLGLPATLGGPIDDLDTSQAQIAYALESEWQLREVMAQFWERHFNTFLFAQRNYFVPWIGGATEDYWAWWFEWEANEHYRANALTTFHDLLVFTAHHASMMIYLHMPQNNGANPNEDFARELCELYTMSPEQVLPGEVVVKNYEQSDIENIARILTGWDLDEANGFVFQFDDADHAYPTGPTALFGGSTQPVSIPARVSPNGEQEGLDLLAELAKHPATKAFVSRKLIAHFVGEELAAAPTSSVLTAMLAAWGDEGDIVAVLGALFASPQFLGSDSHLTRIRMPLESVVATVRALEGTIREDPTTGLADPASLNSMNLAMAAQGQSLLKYPAPNGYQTDDASQLSPSVGIERAYWGWNVLFSLLGSPPGSWSPATDPVAYVQPVQPPLPASPTRTNVVPHLYAVVDYLLTSFYGSNYTEADEFRVREAIAGTILWIDQNPAGTTYGGPWDPAVAEHYEAVIWVACTAALGFVQSGQR
ncbi:MAG: DUF1800 family protein [Planctomycetes bacterium]|nr:DUF1800 family protein [Planctomycetota bacterium]